MENKGMAYIEVLISLTILVIAMFSLLEGFRVAHMNMFIARDNYKLFKVTQMLANDVRASLINDSSSLFVNGGVDYSYVLSPPIWQNIEREKITYVVFIKKLALSNENEEIAFFTNSETAVVDRNELVKNAFSDYSINMSGYYNFWSNIEIDSIPKVKLNYNLDIPGFEFTDDSFDSDLIFEFDSENLLIRYPVSSLKSSEIVFIDLKDFNQLDNNGKLNIELENYSNSVLDIIINKCPAFNNVVNINANNYSDGFILVNSNEFMDNDDENFSDVFLVKVVVNDSQNNSHFLFDIVRKG